VTSDPGVEPAEPAPGTSRAGVTTGATPTVERSATWPLEARRVVRRQRWFLVVAGVATLVSVGGLVASTGVRSPAQRAAEQSPPAASVLTAAVQSQVLTSTVAVRGTVTADSTIAVTVPGTAPAGSVLTLTRTPKVSGNVVEAGDVLCEISARPVLALPGQIPSYRDLVPGSTGSDVVELQDALRSLGLLGDASDGMFGPRTQAAVQRLYEARGYTALTTTDVNGAAETDALAAARASERTAQRAVRDATAAVSAADPLTVDAARQALADAKEDLVVSQAALARLQAQVGVVVPLGEVVFVPQLPAAIGTVGAAVGTVLSSATSVLTLLTGQLSVHAVAPEGQQHLLSAGQTVTIVDDVRSRTTTGTLTAIGPYTDPTARDGSAAAGEGMPSGTAGYPLVVATTEPLDSTWLNADVLVQVTAATTTTPVLIVPATAIATRADGTTFVQVLTGGTDHRDVAVVTGAAADGQVQVTASTPGELRTGDEVLVGSS